MGINMWGFWAIKKSQVFFNLDLYMVFVWGGGFGGLLLLMVYKLKIFIVLVFNHS